MSGKSPWQKIGGIAKQDVEPITSRYFDRRKIWRSDKWQNRREGKVRCEWCGDEPETIQLHHEDDRWGRIDWYNTWDTEAYSLFERYGDYDEGMEEGEREYMEGVVQFVQEHRGFVAHNFKDTVKGLAEQYREKADVVPLCKSCHYAWENKRMKICGICEESYGPHRNWDQYRGDEDLPEYACWDCVVDVKGLEECHCEDGFYDPDENDECFSCRDPIPEPDAMGDPHP